MRLLLPVFVLAMGTCAVSQDINHPAVARATSEYFQTRGTKPADSDSGKLYSAELSPSLKSDEAALSGAPVSSALAATTVEPVYRLERPVRQNRVPESHMDHRRAWLLLTATQHSSAIFDAWSTRQALLSGHGYERDVLVRPFANSDAIYPALQVVPIGLDFLSRRMLRSSNSFSRRTWWVPQAIATTGFVWCGTRNLRVAR
ncbi:MAG TPA: hypothetical protein VM912_18180 [Terriglobales bacterium]|nr:hypothetical protein [Terriglobales bacterium]